MKKKTAILLERLSKQTKGLSTDCVIRGAVSAAEAFTRDCPSHDCTPCLSRKVKETLLKRSSKNR